MRKVSIICFVAVLCCGLGFAQRNKNKATDRSSAEKNKTTARRVFDDLFSRGSYELIDSMYEKGAIVHFGNREARLDDAVSEGKEWRSAFPDLVVRAEQVTGNGDVVEVRWSAHGTNKGRGRGLPGKGKQAKTQGTSKFKFNGDKIAEVWVDWNENEVRRQVGGK
jgi:predicted ester cyclase